MPAQALGFAFAGRTNGSVRPHVACPYVDTG